MFILVKQVIIFIGKVRILLILGMQIKGLLLYSEHQ